MATKRKKKYPLDGLGLSIKAHWKTYRPRMYAGLERRAPRQPGSGRQARRLPAPRPAALPKVTFDMQDLELPPEGERGGR